MFTWAGAAGLLAACARSVDHSHSQHHDGNKSVCRGSFEIYVDGPGRLLGASKTGVHMAMRAVSMHALYRNCFSTPAFLHLGGQAAGGRGNHGTRAPRRDVRFLDHAGRLKEPCRMNRAFVPPLDCASRHRGSCRAAWTMQVGLMLILLLFSDSTNTLCAHCLLNFCILQGCTER